MIPTASIKRLAFSSLLASLVPLIMLYYSEVPCLFVDSYSTHPAMFLIFLVSTVMLLLTSESYLMKRYFGYLHITFPLRPYLAIFSFILFLFGTYFQSGFLQLAGILLTFLTMVGYLGGKGTALATLPSLLFMTLFLSSLSDFEISFSVLFFILSFFMGYLAFRTKRIQSNDCQYCQTYRGDGRKFCLYCGKLLNQEPFIFPARKAISVILVALLLLGIFQVNIYVFTQADNTLMVKVINLGREQIVPPIPLNPAISISNLKVVKSNTGPVFVYNLTYGNVLNQKAYFALANSVGAAQSDLLIYTAAKPLNTKQPYQISNSLYTWNVSSTPFFGIMTYFPVKVIRGENISNEFAALLVGEDSQSFMQESGTSVRDLVSSVGEFSSSHISSSLLLSIYTDFLLKFFSFIETAFLLFILLLLASYARSIDSNNKRVFDSTLALSLADFKLLSFFRKGNRSKTGSEMMQIASQYNPSLGWNQLVTFIERLKWLHILEENISLREGEPRLVWRFRL